MLKPFTGVVWAFLALKQESTSNAERPAIDLGAINVGGSVVGMQVMAGQHQRCGAMIGVGFLFSS